MCKFADGKLGSPTGLHGYWLALVTQCCIANYPQTQSFQHPSFSQIGRLTGLSGAALLHGGSDGESVAGWIYPLGVNSGLRGRRSINLPGEELLTAMAEAQDKVS